MAQGVQGSRRSVCVWANVDRSAARRGRERPRSRRRPPVNRIPDGSAPLSGAPFPSYRGPRARRMRVPSVVRNLLYGENLNLFSKQRRFRHPPYAGNPVGNGTRASFGFAAGARAGSGPRPCLISAEGKRINDNGGCIRARFPLRDVVARSGPTGKGSLDYMDLTDNMGVLL